MKQLRIIFTLVTLLSFIQIKAQSIPDHSIWDQLLILNVSDDGNVNYKGVIKDSPLLYKYLRSLSQNPPQEEWAKEEKLVYWINLYNAEVLKIVIDNYPIKTEDERKELWKQPFFKVGDERYSLEEIENKVLRKMEEPRIFFLINKATKSHPALWNRAYTSENINSQLEQRVKKFINDPSKNIITQDQISISKIFDWYKDDFEKGDAIKFINKYAEVEIKKIPKKGYMEFDWSLNEQ